MLLTYSETPAAIHSHWEFINFSFIALSIKYESRSYMHENWWIYFGGSHKVVLKTCLSIEFQFALITNVLVYIKIYRNRHIEGDRLFCISFMEIF